MQVEFKIPNNLKKYPFCELMFNAPHVLIAGTNGSGKSTLLDDYMYTLLGKYFPNEISLVLIDPKEVGLSKYKRLPHVERFETENSKIIDCLDDVIYTMEQRYKHMREKGIEDYDGMYIVVVIDELADLMTTCKKELLPRIQRIAQKGRASKIKLVCASQSPSRKMIPAELTLNFNGRCALRCISAVESKQIINRSGAEFLPEHGKALYWHSNGKYYECDVPLTSRKDLIDRINLWVSQTPNGWKGHKTVSTTKESFFHRLWYGTK